MITGPAPRNRRITPGGAVRQHLDSDPCAVYRIYDASGELVYIGMGHEPDARVSAHRADKPWREHIATYEVTWHPNRADAFAAEAKLVKAERPRYNVVHTPTHRERSLRHLDGRRVRQPQPIDEAKPLLRVLGQALASTPRAQPLPERTRAAMAQLPESVVHKLVQLAAAISDAAQIAEGRTGGTKRSKEDQTT